MVPNRITGKSWANILRGVTKTLAGIRTGVAITPRLQKVWSLRMSGARTNQSGAKLDE